MIKKTVPGPDGKPVEICLDGEKCSLMCEYRWRRRSHTTCVKFGLGNGVTPHPNCIGPKIDAGPVDYLTVEEGKRYFIVGEKSQVNWQAEEIHVYDTRDTYIKRYVFVSGISRVDHCLFDDDEIYTDREAACRRAVKILEEKLKELREKI